MIIHNYFNIISVLVLFLIVLYFINKENNYFSFNCKNENFAVLVCDNELKQLVEDEMSNYRIDYSDETKKKDISNYNIEAIRQHLFKKSTIDYLFENILLSKIIIKDFDIKKQKEIVFGAKKKYKDLPDSDKKKKEDAKKNLNKEQKKITDEISKEELTEKFITLQHIKDIIKEKLKKDENKTKIVVNRTSDIFDTSGLENVIDIGKIRGSVDQGIQSL